LQATLNTTDTNDANEIVWSGGQSVPGNPYQRRVTTTASAKTTVTATLGPTNLSQTVWVLWGKITLLTNGTNPSDAPSMPSNVPGGDQLGVQYGNASNYAAGKICVVGNVTPPGVHAVITTGWNINAQMKIGLDYSNGIAVPEWTFTNWTDDPTITINIPDQNDNIYLIDGPNIGAFASTSYETYRNFYDCFTWNGGMKNSQTQIVMTADRRSPSYFLRSVV
jgi:hypothetical protein